MDASCQCGAVQFRTPAPAPLAVYHCHCRECRRQSSSAFGTSAVFAAGDMSFLDAVADRLSVYIRPGERARSGRDMACYFCSQCGARVMHRYLKGRGRARTPAAAPALAASDFDGPTLTIKGGIIAGLDYASAVHIYTEHAVVPIPAGVEQYPGTPPASP